MSNTSGNERNTGLWFDEKGAYFLIESSDKNDDPEMEPIMALAYRMKAIMRAYPEINDWIMENPSSEVSDKKEWWKSLIVVCIQHGWNLLWNGSLITAIGDINAAKCLLQGCPDGVIELGLDPEEEIVVLKLGEAGGKVVKWSNLTGSDQPSQSEGTQTVAGPKMVIHNPLRQLQELRTMLETMLISQDEYNAARSAIMSYILRDWIKQP